MELSRVDTGKLKVAVLDARAALDKMRQALNPLLVTDLTEEERSEVLRAPVRLSDAAKDLALLARTRPDLTAAAGYDADAVMEDLDNHALLSGLAETLRELAKWVDDSKLVWSGEVYEQSLRLYNVAKVLERSDGSLRSLVGPLESVFAAARGRRRSREESPPTE